MAFGGSREIALFRDISRRLMRNLAVLLVLVLLGGSPGAQGPRQSAYLDNEVLNAGLDPANPKIVALVAHFQARGILLVHDERSWWRVVPPASPEFEVLVSLRAFPSDARAERQQEALKRINLAYLLNAEAHVAMSYPVVRGAGGGALKDARFVLLKSRLEQLFREYRPQVASSTPGR
ncbi:MAG: hypothetical protein ABI624_25265 [Casimicrobiaceae bacterium]